MIERLKKLFKEPERRPLSTLSQSILSACLTEAYMEGARLGDARTKVYEHQPDRPKQMSTAFLKCHGRLVAKGYLEKSDMMGQGGWHHYHITTLGYEVLTKGEMI